MLIENTNISNINIITKVNTPDAPTIGTVTILSSTSATVSYTEPNYNGGSQITSYTAVSSPGGITATLNQSGSGTITVTGLTKNTSYTFTVYATNISGNGLSSSSSVSKTTLPDIGDSYGGGYFAGQISTSADGIPTHNLVIAPLSTGYSASTYTLYNGSANKPSRIDGPGNTTWLVNNGSGFAANFCRNLTVGGYSDWYLPAIDELEVAFYNLRPGLAVSGNYNNTSYGVNSYSVPQRTSNYTTTIPGQTIATAFRTNGAEWGFGDTGYGLMSSTCESGGGTVSSLTFNNGGSTNGVGTPHTYGQNVTMAVRAFRRVAI